MTRGSPARGGRRFGLGASLLLAAASCTGVVEDQLPIEDFEDPQQQPLPPDDCNSVADALNNPVCKLTVGQSLSEFIGLPGDQDWYTVVLPDSLTPRSLVHVSATYTAPNTGVSLFMNVLREDGRTSLSSGVDKHGQAAPRPVDLVIRFSESRARLVVMVSDQAGRNYDARSKYTLKVEVVEDPDANEPNDTSPSVVTLSSQGDALVGSGAGYLATQNDVDRFSLTLPAAQKVLYLHITGPLLKPAPQVRVSYTLFDPSGKPFAEGRMANEFLAIDLATARVSTGGTYVLAIQGLVTDPALPVPGDVRLAYTLDVKVLPEVDGSEPNDSIEAAKVVPLGTPGQSANITARIGHVPDPDWYAIDLSSSSSPTVLHYKVTPTSNGGRFAPLPGLVDRQVRLLTPVTQGTSLADKVSNCRKNASVCPRRNDTPDVLQSLVDTYCGLSTPVCLWSSRQETVKFDNLRNFEGAILVPPHSGNLRYFLLVEDSGNDWADDKDYQLAIDWRTDGDEAGRWSGSTEGTVSRPLQLDSAAASFPAPPSGSAYELTGHLSYGYGYLRNHDPIRGEGIRAPMDYDAAPSDEDRYELVFPGGLAAPLDRTWELQWEVQHGPNGRPYDLVLELEFCDGSQGAGSCSSVTRGTSGSDLAIGYRGGDLGSWHSTGVQGANRQPVFSQTTVGNATQVTALAYGCFCFEPRFVQGGKFYLKVVGVDRDSYADTQYTIRTALTSYPMAYSGGTCPAVGALADGGTGSGCQFTRQ